MEEDRPCLKYCPTGQKERVVEGPVWELGQIQRALKGVIDGTLGPSRNVCMEGAETQT